MIDTIMKVNGYVVKSGTMDRFVSMDQVNSKLDLRWVARQAIEEYVKNSYCPLGSMVKVFACYYNDRIEKQYSLAENPVIETSIHDLSRIGTTPWIVIKIDEEELYPKVNQLLQQYNELRKIVEEKKDKKERIGFLRQFCRKIW